MTWRGNLGQPGVAAALGAARLLGFGTAFANRLLDGIEPRDGLRLTNRTAKKALWR